MDGEGSFWDSLQTPTVNQGFKKLQIALNAMVVTCSIHPKKIQLPSHAFGRSGDANI